MQMATGQRPLKAPILKRIEYGLSKKYANLAISLGLHGLAIRYYMDMYCIARLLLLPQNQAAICKGIGDSRYRIAMGNRHEPKLAKKNLARAMDAYKEALSHCKKIDSPKGNAAKSAELPEFEAECRYMLGLCQEASGKVLHALRNYLGAFGILDKYNRELHKNMAPSLHPKIWSPKNHPECAKILDAIKRHTTKIEDGKGSLAG